MINELVAPSTDGNPDRAAWVAMVEECFVAIRGRGVLWAPEDAARALRWCEAGVPIGVVVRVLQARVRAWQFQHGSTARLPMHLGWYEPAVLQALRPLAVTTAAHPSPGVATADVAPTTASAQLAELLDAVPQLLSATGDLGLQHAYRKAFDLIDAAQRPARPEVVDTEAPTADPRDVIDKCRSMLRKTTLLGLRDADAAALQAWLAPQLAGIAGRLSKRALQARKDVLQEQWLAEHLGLRVPTAEGWIDPRAAL